MGRTGTVKMEETCLPKSILGTKQNAFENWICLRAASLISPSSDIFGFLSSKHLAFWECVPHSLEHAFAQRIYFSDFPWYNWLSWRDVWICISGVLGVFGGHWIRKDYFLKNCTMFLLWGRHCTQFFINSFFNIQIYKHHFKKSQWSHLKFHHNPLRSL